MNHPRAAFLGVFLAMVSGAALADPIMDRVNAYQYLYDAGSYVNWYYDDTGRSITVVAAIDGNGDVVHASSFDSSTGEEVPSSYPPFNQSFGSWNAGMPFGQAGGGAASGAGSFYYVDPCMASGDCYDTHMP